MVPAVYRKNAKGVGGFGYVMTDDYELLDVARRRRPVARRVLADAAPSAPCVRCGAVVAACGGGELGLKATNLPAPPFTLCTAQVQRQSTGSNPARAPPPEMPTCPGR